MNIAVIGANGFVGTRLVEILRTPAPAGFLSLFTR